MVNKAIKVNEHGTAYFINRYGEFVCCPIWYPDFRLPQYYEMIIEYFGMNGNTGYDEQTIHKIETYTKAGIEGINMLESSFLGNWQEQILERIEQSLEGKLQLIQSKQNLINSENRKELSG